jgi:hypothetical protein
MKYDIYIFAPPHSTTPQHGKKRRFFDFFRVFFGPIDGIDSCEYFFEKGNNTLPQGTGVYQGVNEIGG